jgi:Protein of unknown function (DUF1631)
LNSKTGNHLGRRMAAKTEPSPITALRDMLATAFAADIAAVTPEVCEVLRFGIQGEEKPARRDAMRNALVILARQSAELSLAIIGEVRSRFDAKLAPGADSFAKTSQFSMDDLTLVDDAALQVELALDQCAGRLREQSSAEVFQLSARMCEMLGVESIADSANPILPRVFARALLESIAKLGLNDEAKLPVFKAYGPALLHIAPDLYRHANSLLGDLGVLPGFKARYGSPLQGAQVPERSAPAMSDERVVKSLLERLMNGERAQRGGEVTNAAL